MAVIKDKERRTWRVYITYKDWQGKPKIHTKRGFKTKKEGLEYEREFLQRKKKDVNMEFKTFVGQYLEDIRPRIKEHTYLSKEYLINGKILPYFENKKLSEISSIDVIQWQNELLKMRDEKGKSYSLTYLRTIQNNLTAIFNHAVRYYSLRENPATKAGKMGKAKASEMKFWTQEEYLKFSEAIKDKPIMFYAFEVLFWTGIREGELLALERGDFDLEARKLTINKSYQRIKRKEYITTPKTEKSNRVICLTKSLCDEMEDYFCSIYKIDSDTRLFPVSKSLLANEMQRGAAKAGVKKIRIHDLRHSHVALLVNLGFSTIEIAERMGHENSTITDLYAHLYPSKQEEMIEKLDACRKESENDNGRDF